MKNLKYFFLLWSSIFTLLSFNVEAQTGSQDHIVVAPSCLIKNLNGHYETLASANNLSLIKINTLAQLIAYKNQHTPFPCGGFMNVTSKWHQFNTKHHATKNLANVFLQQIINIPKAKHSPTLKYKVQYPVEVNQLIQQLNPQNMWTDLTTLTHFKNRNANSKYGRQAAYWFKAQVEALAKINNRDDVSVSLIETDDYKQPSVIAKIGHSSEAGIVMSAHMDTTASEFEDNELKPGIDDSREPGADDDGTGSVTILESLRVLLASGMQFKKPIYFIWYAAEEEGLIGSQQVVSEFKEKNIPIDAVLHFDLTGYAFQNESTLWLMDDYVDKDLVSYLETLINTYVKQPVKHTRCGYACSDHATWTQNGYVAAIPAESKFVHTNPNIHTTNDTMDKLSLAHMTDYAKLAFAFMVELAEPVHRG